MKLAFQTLTVENFRCFARRQVFDLSPSPGLWFLRGKNTVEPALQSNGAGKSSLFEAFCWVLEGQTSRKLKNPDIKPWLGKGVPTVELRFLKDGVQQSIRRTATTNGLQINGKEAGLGEAVKLLGLSLDVLLNTGFFAQGQPLFLDRTPKEKFALFSEVLPLERWEERSGKAAKRVKELESLEAEMTGEVAGLQAALAQTERLLVQARQDSKTWEAARQERSKATGTQIKDLETQLTRQEAELGKAELAFDGAWTKLREMREDLRSLQKTADAARRQFQAEESEIARARRELVFVKKELDQLGTAKTCPTCGQPVRKNQLGAHKNELEAQIETLADRVAAGVPKNVRVLHEGAEDALANFDAEIRKAEDQTDALQSKLNLLKPAVETLKTKLWAARESQQERTQESNPYTDQIYTLKRQKAKTTQDIDALEADLLKAKQQIERTAFWIKGFKDVALYLIEEVLQELEAVTNTLLGEVGLVGWQIKYDIERETKSGTVQRGVNVTVLPPGFKGAVRWESWSGGESQRLRLVGALALGEVLLRRAGVGTNLEVFDEPTQHLSPAGVADLCAYLSARAKAQNKTIWMIDHVAREGMSFAGTVTVEKTKEGSVVRS